MEFEKQLIDTSDEKIVNKMLSIVIDRYFADRIETKKSFFDDMSFKETKEDFIKYIESEGREL